MVVACGVFVLSASPWLSTQEVLALSLSHGHVFKIQNVMLNCLDHFNDFKNVSSEAVDKVYPYQPIRNETHELAPCLFVFLYII